MQHISTLTRSFLNKLGTAPDTILFVILGLSVMALAGAYTAQYGFGLRPCDLCLFQRVPFALNIALTLAALYCRLPARLATALCGLSFAANSGLAFFHSGVERHWWKGLSGCTAPDMSGSVDEILKRLSETNATRCDEIPWEMFGLSMANYNVAFCLAAAILCAVPLICHKSNPSAIDKMTKQPT